MIGENYKKITSNTSSRFSYARPKLSLDCAPIKDEDELGLNSRVSITNFCFFLKFRPNPDKRKRTTPYVIICDLFEKRQLRVEDYQDFYERTKTDDVCSFLSRYTQIDRTIFDIARMHINMEIPIAFDTKKYYNDIVERYGNVTNIFASPTFEKINEMIADEKYIIRQENISGKYIIRRKKA